MMQMKTTDGIGKINTLLAQKNTQTVWMAMKVRIINFDAIFYVLLTCIVLKS